MDLLLAMANAAEAEAESAKKKGDGTLAEAEQILETLRGMCYRSIFQNQNVLEFLFIFNSQQL